MRNTPPVFNYNPMTIYNDLKRLQQESGREYVDLSRKPDQEARKTG